MPPFGPISRADLIYYLRQLGYDGPYSGGRHAVMIRGAHRLTIPNPHSGTTIGRPLLQQVLRQAGITRDEWERL